MTTLSVRGQTSYSRPSGDWRSTYCNPSTLRAQANLVARENGLCTLTQSFEGSGNDISVSHSVSQPIRIHTFIAEPITSETYGGGYVYNPSGIPVGGTAKFKVSLDPMTGLSEDDIVWDNLTSASISFVNGDNLGFEVTVQGNSVGSFFLNPKVNGMNLDPDCFFHGEVMTPTTAPVTVWIVCNDTWGDAPIEESAIQPIIDDANKILKQKALTLDWGGTANYTNRTAWQNITDALNPTNAVLQALLNCTNNTGGLEIYFVKTLKDGGGDLGGLNGNAGLVLAQGNEYGTGFSGLVMAHETLHQCGLYDIYATMTNKTPLVVTGDLSSDRLPYDWGGGYYPKDLTQAQLVKRLVMYGSETTPESPDPGLDLPSGRVYGLRYTDSAPMTTNIWSLGGALVGQSDISANTPVHQ